MNKLERERLYRAGVNVILEAASTHRWHHPRGSIRSHNLTRPSYCPITAAARDILERYYPTRDFTVAALHLLRQELPQCPDTVARRIARDIAAAADSPSPGTTRRIRIRKRLERMATPT